MSTQPFRLARGGRIDRTRPLAFTFDGRAYGGFKATPASGWCFAHTLAKDEPHELNSRFTLDRFRRGYPLDEKGMGPTPWAH